MDRLIVKDIMTPLPALISHDATLEEAARKMKKVDCGFLPVGNDIQLMGVITDRDIVTRAIAKGKDPSQETVAHYMTSHVYACNENDLLIDAANKMRVYKVSRLVVRNGHGNVTGVLSLGGIIRRDAEPSEVTNIIKHILLTEQV